MLYKIEYGFTSNYSSYKKVLFHLKVPVQNLIRKEKTPFDKIPTKEPSILLICSLLSTARNSINNTML